MLKEILRVARIRQAFCDINLEYCNFIFQEYVDTPVLIKFTTENLRKPSTRSDTISEDDFIVTASQQPGSVCVLLSQASNVGDYRLVKCLRVTQGLMELIFLKKCLGGSDNEQYFVETVEINRVPKDSIYAVLISTNIVNPDLKTYSVDKTELEEIIFSLSS